MLFLFALGISSLLFSLVATPLCRELLLRLNLVDSPDNVRKLHKRAVPRMGGIAVFGSYVAALAIAFQFMPSMPVEIPDSIGTVLQLLPAAAIVFLTGVLDDLYTLKPWQKLGGQFIGAGLACAMGVRIVSVNGHDAQQWWGVPLTMVWLLGCTNAFNLIDGVDGLAAGAGLFASSTILVTALLHGNLGLATATIPLAGALVGFLRYNFNPASIFLGDCGSLVIGFMLGSYAVVWSQKSATLLDMTAPLMALALPLLDTGLAITRRFIRSKPIFGADRGHIHHRLLDRGHAPKGVALRLYAVCGVAALFSLLQGLFPGHGILFVAMFATVLLLGVRYLNYIEFAVIGRMFTRGTLRQILQEEIRLQQLEDELRNVDTPEARWVVLQHSCADLAIISMELKFGDLLLHHRSSAPLSEAWSTKVPLAGQGQLTFHRTGESGRGLLTARLVGILRDHFSPNHHSPNHFSANHLSSNEDRLHGPVHMLPGSQERTHYTEPVKPAASAR